MKDTYPWLQYKRQGIRLRWNRYARRTLVLGFSESTGGLGDQLWHTPLPRIAKESGCYSRVLLSKQSFYRHPGMKEVLWDSNPFIDGLVDEDGLSFVNQSIDSDKNVLDQIVKSALITTSVRGLEPEVHDDFPPVDGLQGKTLYDPNFITEAGNLNSESVSNYLAMHAIKVDAQFAPRWRAYPLAGTAVLPTGDLHWFCRAIKHASRVVCFTTGTATLAAALGCPCLVLLWGWSGHGVPP